MNVKRLVFLSVAAMSAMACDDDGDVVLAPQANNAYVRYVNAVNDTLPIDFHPVDKVENGFVAVPFRGLTQYLGFSAGQRVFRAFPNSDDAATTSSVLQEVTLNLEAGKYYTILHAGQTRAGVAAGVEDKIIVIAESDTTSPAATAYKIRGVNAAPGTTVDFYKLASTTTAPSGTPFAAAVPFGSLTNYAQFNRETAAGAAAVRVTSAGTTGTVLASVAAPDGGSLTTGVDPVPGVTVGGSRMTAFYFPATIAGSKAASFTTAGVVIMTDNNVSQ